jgi:gamma-glutamylcyclotransferase (GGCT)/AIG2-like uncharacterized protein YtfP
MTDRVMNSLRLAVNGTLMRGLELNPNLLRAGAIFIRETKTAPIYRLWSIRDQYPAMLRVNSGGSAIAIELWSLSAEGLAAVLSAEPPGLTVGKVRLNDGSEVLGILGESFLCEDQIEITSYGGWRQYRAAQP